jgi:hypothetical protein
MIRILESEVRALRDDRRFRAAVAIYAAMLINPRINASNYQDARHLADKLIAELDRTQQENEMVSAMDSKGAK